MNAARKGKRLRNADSAIACLETTFDCMKAAYDHGVNFFDTAEKLVPLYISSSVYGREQNVGKS